MTSFMIYFLLFQSYVHKAGKLLPNNEQIIKLLKYIFVACIFVIIGLGILIWTKNTTTESNQTLCKDPVYQSYKASTVTMCFIYYYLLKKIDKAIDEQQVDKKIIDLQRRSLLKLKKSIFSVFILTLYAFLWDMIQTFNGGTDTCNSYLFENFIDNILWIISRCAQIQSATFLVLFFFFKRANDNSTFQKVNRK